MLGDPGGPERVRRMVRVSVSGYSGRDVFLSLLPGRWQARAVARGVVKDYRGVLPAQGVAVRLPDGRWYEILDAKGRVSECQ